MKKKKKLKLVKYETRGGAFRYGNCGLWATVRAKAAKQRRKHILFRLVYLQKPSHVPHTRHTMHAHILALNQSNRMSSNSIYCTTVRRLLLLLFHSVFSWYCVLSFASVEKFHTIYAKRKAKYELKLTSIHSRSWFVNKSEIEIITFIGIHCRSEERRMINETKKSRCSREQCDGFNEFVEQHHLGVKWNRIIYDELTMAMQRDTMCPMYVKWEFRIDVDIARNKINNIFGGIYAKQQNISVFFQWTRHILRTNVPKYTFHFMQTDKHPEHFILFDAWIPKPKKESRKSHFFWRWSEHWTCAMCALLCRPSKARRRELCMQCLRR